MVVIEVLAIVDGVVSIKVVAMKSLKFTTP